MYTLNCKGRLLVLDKPIVMGIMNATPDSFYSRSRKIKIDEVLQQAEKMIANGAAILDIGAQSTRPGSERISPTEEAERILPVIEATAKEFPKAIISVDTYYAAVAEQAVKAGASIINDISGGMYDADMLSTVGKLNSPYICMHIKGTPETMQQNPQYDDVTKEVLDFFIQRIDLCRQNNIHDVIIDAGFGFGKTIAHNFELMRHLSVFTMLEKPVMIGISRKSTIYKTLGISVDDALNGTTVLHTIALLNGANILRVHDVREAIEAIELLQAYKG